jgi:hypothetical protein
MFELMDLLQQLPPPPDLLGIFGHYGELKAAYIRALESGDAAKAEERFLELYCHVHGHEAPYTPEERKKVDETRGYWCHAGGISPLIKAGPYIHEETVSADFGAGNGLQGLLFQKLYPHRKTVQIEISSRMVESGRQLQSWLDIPDDRVEWVVDDVFNVSPVGMDFIYLYRPLHPEGAGEEFYTRFAEQLSSSDKPVVIFSIADCLKDYLPPGFEIFYNDGHLTCFKR